MTVCFTDRPARLAGHMQTSKFVPLWSQGKDSFLKDNPNATLSVFSGDNVADLVVELTTRSSPAMISPTTRAFSKAHRQRMVELVRCSSYHRDACYTHVLRRRRAPCLASLGGRGK